MREVRVLARFDDRDPTLVEVPRGRGRVLLLTTGWQPDDSQLGPAADHRVIVEPGDTSIERGTDVLVLARFSGPLPADTHVVFSSPSAQPQRLPLAKSLNDPLFGGRIPSVATDLAYHVEFDGQRSPDYRITVFEYPDVGRIDAEVAFPAYTALETQRIEDTRHVSALEGSTVTLICQLNKPVERAWLADQAGHTLELNSVSDKSTNRRVAIPLSKTQRYTVHLVDANGANRADRQMSELELDSRENRYENRRAPTPAEQQTAREDNQVLNRLRELARRQEDVNKRSQQLQSQLQAARDQAKREELRRHLERLREEQQDMLRDLDELRNRMDQPQNQQRMAQARQRLEQSRQNMRQASESLRQEQLAPALNSGTRAERELEQVRDDFRRRTANQFSDEMRSMRDDARELSRREQELGDRLDQLTGAQRQTLRDNDRTNIVEQMGEQRKRLGELTEEMKTVSEAAETAEQTKGSGGQPRDQPSNGQRPDQPGRGQPTSAPRSGDDRNLDVAGWTGPDGPITAPAWRERLHSYIGGIIRDEGGVLIEAGGIPDHLHLVTRFRPEPSVAEMLNYLWD